MDIGRLASNLEDLQNSTQPTLHSHDNCYVSTTKLAAVLRPGADVRKVTLSGLGGATSRWHTRPASVVGRLRGAFGVSRSDQDPIEHLKVSRCMGDGRSPGACADPCPPMKGTQ